MRAHDAVFARVVTRKPVEDVDPDLLLSGRFRRLLDGAVRDITQKLPQSQRRLELITGEHTFHQTLIVGLALTRQTVLSIWLLASKQTPDRLLFTVKSP